MIVIRLKREGEASLTGGTKEGNTAIIKRRPMEFDIFRVWEDSVYVLSYSTTRIRGGPYRTRTFFFVGKRRVVNVSGFLVFVFSYYSTRIPLPFADPKPLVRVDPS